MASVKKNSENIEVHSKETHGKYVQELCRLCAEYAQTKKEKNKKVKKLASSRTQLIKQFIGIDISSECNEDSKGKYPEKLCTKCDKFLANVKARGLSEKHESLIESFKVKNDSIWCQYDSAKGLESCSVCSRKCDLIIGGRPKSIKHGLGASYEERLDPYFSLISECPKMETEGFDIAGLNDRQQRHYLCTVCLNILSPRSLHTPCGHDFCSHCFAAACPGNNAKCPECKHTFHNSQLLSLKTANRKTYTQLMELDVSCKKCKTVNSLENMINHTCPVTALHPTLTNLLQNKPMPKEQAHISPVKTPENSPIKPNDEQTFTKVLKKKLAISPEGIVSASTPGQPIHLIALPKPRKQSSTASSPLKRARTQVLRRVRMFLSGRGKLSYQKQQAAEIKVLSKAQKRALSIEAGLLPQKELTARLGLMMKTYARLSSRQSLKIKQCLKKIGVKYATEAEERTEREKLLIGINIACSNMNFEFKDDKAAKSVNGIVIKPRPCARVENLEETVLNTIDKYEETGKITWRDGAIPQNEYWVKFGGDKGGSTTKLCFQLANLETPNSVEHTRIFCNFSAPDYTANLCQVMQRFEAALSALNGKEWNDKLIQVIVTGDCEFIFRIYGIAGAKGTYPCFICRIDKKIMQKSPYKRAKAILRTLEQLKKDYAEFKKAGCPIKKQSKYFNVISHPLINISICNVCIPYLHILLGICKKHFDLLEIECLGLEKILAEYRAMIMPRLNDTLYEDYVQKIREKHVLQIEISHLNDEIEELEDMCSLATLGSENDEISALKMRKINAENKINKLEADMNITGETGIITSHLDVLLQKYHIHRQRYHGKSFVGNDCHKLCKEDVFTNYFFDLEQHIRSLTADPQIIQKGVEICDKFCKLQKLYSDVHSSISHSDMIAQDDIPSIQQKIDIYMSFYREQFPEKSVILKQHLLEDHVCDFLSKWKVGFGLLGEQGVEQIHAEYNEIDGRMASTWDPVKRSLLAMKRHWTGVSPDILELKPDIKRRIVHIH